MLGKTVTVRELIVALQEMPQDHKVYMWENDRRVPIDDVVDVGDVVDLYSYEDQE